MGGFLSLQVGEKIFNKIKIKIFYQPKPQNKKMKKNFLGKNFFTFPPNRVLKTNFGAPPQSLPAKKGLGPFLKNWA